MLLEGHRFDETSSSVLPYTEISLSVGNWKGIEEVVELPTDTVDRPSAPLWCYAISPWQC